MMQSFFALKFAMMQRMFALILVVASLSFSFADQPRSIHWSLDRTNEPTAPLEGVGKAEAIGDPLPSFSDDIPGSWIYDPLAGKSRRNSGSLSLQGVDNKGTALRIEVDAKAFENTNRVTFEAFVRPSAEAQGNAWVFGKTRLTNAGSEGAIQFHELRQHHQTYLGAAVATANQQPHRWMSGHYASSSRLQKNSIEWRHLALVIDLERKTAECLIDYHLASEMKFTESFVWDNGPLMIGGLAERWGVAGLIDEPRLTFAALTPRQFMRARNDEIENVSFASDQSIAPRDAGCYDVKEHFGAVGDGKTDDTAAFNSAFRHLASKVPLAYNTLLIPPGTYLVSDMLHCSRFIDVKGAGPDRTIIQLRDGTFTEPQKPRPVLRMSSTAGDPGSHKWVNGSSISIYLEGVTISTGKNNPGAKGLEYHSNNLGRLENTVIRSEDGVGVIGLDLTHHDVGPALVKHVLIDGFDFAGAINHQEYSMTLEHVEIKNQKVAGIVNRGNIMAIRKLRSENRVPAIVCEGPNSMLSLLDSELLGGSSDAPAIRAAGAFYALRVKTAGYGSAIEKRILIDQKNNEWRNEKVAGPNLEEYVGDHVVNGFGVSKGALKLSIEETPKPSLPPVSQWVSVAKFVDARKGDDAAPVLQAAIDSGAKVIYIPREFDLPLRTPVKLHSVERIVGYGRGLSWAKGSNNAGKDTPPEPLLIFDEPDSTRTIVLDRLDCQHVRHASKATLVLRSGTPQRYTTGLAGGKLFAEDIGGADWHFDHPQRVWVRQWNPESHAAGPCIESNGATIWSLGFKTEYESQKFRACNGAATEILGSFIYPLGKIPQDRPIFENIDSRMSLIYGTSVYQANHKIHILDRRGTEEKRIGNDSLRWAGSRARMDLYTSDAAGPQP